MAVVIFGVLLGQVQGAGVSLKPGTTLALLVSGLVTISVGKFLKPKWIKSIPSARSIDH